MLKSNVSVIDLSHTIKEGMPVFPGDPAPEFHGNSFIEKDNYRDTSISMTTHTGTHLDCPGHIFQNGKTINDYHVNRFYGKGCLVNCTEINTGSSIKKNLLKGYEHQINDADFVLLYTGWSRLWEKPEYFKNFPVLDIDSAQYLLQFDLKGIGVDTPSVDSVESSNLKIHTVFLSNNIIIIENLANLVYLIDKSFYFCCFPLKIEGGDGSPVRATAILQ